VMQGWQQIAMQWLCHFSSWNSKAGDGNRVLTGTVVALQSLLRIKQWHQEKQKNQQAVTAAANQEKIKMMWCNNPWAANSDSNSKHSSIRKWAFWLCNRGLSAVDYEWIFHKENQLDGTSNK